MALWRVSASPLAANQLAIMTDNRTNLVTKLHLVTGMHAKLNFAFVVDPEFATAAIHGNKQRNSNHSRAIRE